MNSYFEIQPLDYILYMFLTCMPIFMSIGCNLPFDLWTHLLCLILMGKIFYSLLREREGEYQMLKFLNFRLPFWSWKCYHFFFFFYGYNCLENKDRPFLYRMYIKDFFLDCKPKVHLKNTKCYMFMRFFLFSLNFKINFISKQN